MKKRTNLQRIQKFLSPLKKRKSEYSRQFVTCMVMGSGGVVPIFFLERITYFLEQTNAELFQKTLIAFFLYIIIFEMVSFGTRKWGWVETETMGQYDIEKEILNKYIRLNNNDIEKIGTGKLISIITTGKMTWLLTLSRAMMVGVGLIISTCLAFYMMLKLNSLFSVLFIFLMMLVFTYAYFVNKKMGIFREERYEIRNSRMKRIVKVLMSKNEILHSNKIEEELESLKDIAIREKIQNQNMGIYRKLLRSTPVFVMSLVIFGFFYIGGNKVLTESLSLSQLVGITGALIIMQKTVIEAVNFFVDLSKDFINIEKMWDFFENTPELLGYDIGKKFLYKKGDINIKNLYFAYEKGQDVFKDFHLNLKGGKIYALVGNSGSGKSTLAKIISGYLAAQNGDIVIDGQRMRDISLKSYYGEIGYLTQEPSVFDGTILDNLTYAINGEVSEARLEEIIQLTKCDFIYDFKDGLKTEIGEKGIRLSGGQRQRLAIAKIMLKDPKIVILDEPTSALDSFSEEQITYAMNNLFTGRTVIVIAHRLQTVKHADTIFVFKDGKIVEQGNHKELVAKNGIYNKMLELQSGF